MWAAIKAAPLVDEADIDVAVGESPLTATETRQLYLLSVGIRNHEIARVEGVGYDTVRTRAQTIRRKLGADTTLHAVAIAIRRGLLPH